jgi:hypothetical protein
MVCVEVVSRFSFCFAQCCVSGGVFTAILNYFGHFEHE